MGSNNQNHEVSQSSPPEIKRWLVFSIIAMSLLAMTIDSTIVATALHSLQKDLNTTVSWAGWTLTAYSFGFVLMLPLSAKLSIRYGHKRIFMWSIMIFTIASVLCGLSGNIYVLIFFRIIQAMGGAGITPSATGLIVDYFGASRAQFLGLFGSIFSSGAIIGPVFGGIIVTYWSWHWIFFINIPLGLAILFLASKFIPPDTDTFGKRESMDIPGLLYMGLAIIASMYAATHLAEEQEAWLSPSFYGVIAVAIGSFVLLFRHLNRAKEPFIQPILIWGKGFGAVNLFNIIYSGMGIGLNSLIPLYAITRYGISDLASGTILVANGIASMLLSAIMSLYINKTGYRLPLYIGSVIAATGMSLLFVTPPFDINPITWLMFCTFMMGTGYGMVSPAGRNAGLQLAPDQSANIAAVRSMGMQLGQLISIAIATAIISASVNPGLTHGKIYMGLAIIIIILLYPIISRVPENKGSW